MSWKIDPTYPRLVIDGTGRIVALFLTEEDARHVVKSQSQVQNFDLFKAKMLEAVGVLAGTTFEEQGVKSDEPSRSHSNLDPSTTDAELDSPINLDELEVSIKDEERDGVEKHNRSTKKHDDDPDTFGDNFARAFAE